MLLSFGMADDELEGVQVEEDTVKDFEEDVGT